MPSPGYTSPKTKKGKEARRRAFDAYWRKRVNPKDTQQGGLKRRAPFVSPDPSDYRERKQRS